MPASDFKERTYANAPPLEGYWMVLGWGNIVGANRGFHELRVHFVKLSDTLELKKTPDFFHVRMHQSTVVDIGSLRLFSPGSIWKGQRLIAQLSEYRDLPATFTVLDISNSLKGKLGDFFDTGSNKFFVPEPAREIPVRIFQNKIHYDDHKHRSVVVIPEAAIADYYSFGYFRLIDKVLSGKINTKNHVFDPSLSSFSMAEDGKILAHVRLEKEMKDYDAFKIARMAHDSYYLKKVREINANMISRSKEGKPVYIESDFPVKGPSELKILGRQVQTEKGLVYFAYRIVGCSVRPSFDYLVFSRDNPGKTSNQEEGKRRNESSIAQKVFTEGSNSELGNNEPNSKSTDINESILYSETIPISEDNIVKETDLLTQITDNLPVVFLPAEFVEKLSTRPEKIGNDEVARIVLEFDQRIDKLKIDRFEKQFEFVNKACEILESNLTGELKFRKTLRTPIKNIKAHFQGFSIFPYTRFIEKGSDPNLDVHYQWCFLNKSRSKNKKNIYYNERRALLIEYLIGPSCFYIIEVEAKYSSGSHLFILRSKSGNMLIDDYLVEVLFEIANHNGNGKKVKGYFSKSNKFEVGILKHTTQEKLSSDLLNWILKSN